MNNAGNRAPPPMQAAGPLTPALTARAPCPSCSKAAVALRGPGVAACTDCRAQFVAIAAATLALGAIDRARLLEAAGGNGSRAKPCPACAQEMFSLPLIDEITSVCSACQALWCSKAAQLRMRELAVAQQQRGQELQPARNATNPGRAATNPGRAITDPGRTTTSPGVPVPALPSAAAPVQREPSAARPRPTTGERRFPPATTQAWLARTVIAGAVLLIACATAWRLIAPDRTEIGGGATVDFGEKVAATEDIDIEGVAQARRFFVVQKNARHAAVFLPGAGRGRRDPGEVLAALFGLKLDGTARDLGGLRLLTGTFTTAATTAAEAPRRGAFRAFFTSENAWVLSVESEGREPLDQEDERHDRFLSSLRGVD